MAWVPDSMQADEKVEGQLVVIDPSNCVRNQGRFLISASGTINIHQEVSPKDVVPMSTIFELLKIGQPISFSCDVIEFAQ